MARVRVLAAVLAVAVAAALLAARNCGGEEGDAPRGHSTRAGSTERPADDRPPPPRPRTPRARARAAEPSPGGDDAPDPNVRVLRLVTESGMGVPGVWVKLDRPPDAATLRTDADGEVRVPWDGTGAPPVAKFQDGRDHEQAALREPVTRVVLTSVCEILVRVVDARTGAPLDGTRVDVGVRGRDVAIESGREAASGAAEGVAAVRDELGRVRFSFRPTLPERYASSGWGFWDGDVTRHARRVLLEIPVYPAVRRSFRLLDAHGAPVRGAELSIVTARAVDGANAGGTPPEAHAYESGPDGLIHVERLPEMPGSRVTLVFTRAGVAGDDVERALDLKGDVTLRLDEAPTGEPPEVTMLAVPPYVVGIGGGAGGAFGGRRGGPRSTSPATHVSLTVLRADGSPAPGVEVRPVGATLGYRTGERGVAEFDVTTPGAVVVVVSGDGFLPTAVRALPGSSGLVVRETTGRTVRLEVVSEDGTPIPAATVRAESVTVPGPDGVPVAASYPIVQWQDDAERLRPLTDGFGRIDLRMPEGTALYRVTVGEQSAAVTSAEPLVRVVVPLR